MDRLRVMGSDEVPMEGQATSRYAQPPIREAIIDLRVSLPATVSIATLRDLCDRVRDRFPEQEPLVTGTISLQSAPMLQVAAGQRQDGFICRSADGTKVFQATLAGFTFNQLKPYTAWEQFSAEARSLWQEYRDVCQPTVVVRAGVRFINQINLPGPALDFKDYLRTSPEVAPELPQGLSGFFMQLQIPQEDINCMLVLSEALLPPSGPDVVPVLLDIDLFREQLWQSDDESIWGFLEQLRERKNRVFEASITEMTRRLFG